MSDLVLPGVPRGEAPPPTDAEILVSQGHVFAARIADHLSRFYRLKRYAFLLVIALAFSLGQSIYQIKITPSDLQSVHFPSPLARVSVPFSTVKYPASPALVASDIRRVSAAFRRAKISKTLPRGLSQSQADNLVNSLFGWINNSNFSQPLSASAATSGLPASSTLTLNSAFLQHISKASLAGGLIGIPKRPLALTQTKSSAVFTNQPPSIGPFDFAAIINHKVGLYVFAKANFGFVCTTIIGPAIANVCPAVGQSAVNQDFSHVGTSSKVLDFLARHRTLASK